MQLKPQNKKLAWTNHSREKMRYYGLSENRLKRVLRHPDRIEEGVALNTVALMQKAGSSKHPYEVWLMYQEKNGDIVIISVWRYPGTSPVGDKIPIPEDVLRELYD